MRLSRRGEGVRRRAAALAGAGRRGRRHPARLPLRRRPAPGALALHRPLRRADGAPRGAAAARPLHGAARHPAASPTRARARTRPSSGRCRAPPPSLVHMLERGFSVRLLTDTGNSVPGEGADGFAGASQESADAAGLMMDTLAVVDHSDGAGLSRGVRRAARRRTKDCWWPSSATWTRSRRRWSARMRQRSGARGRVRAGQRRPGCGNRAIVPGGRRGRGCDGAAAACCARRAGRRCGRAAPGSPPLERAVAQQADRRAHRGRRRCAARRPGRDGA